MRRLALGWALSLFAALVGGPVWAQSASGVATVTTDDGVVVYSRGAQQSAARSTTSDAPPWPLVSNAGSHLPDAAQPLPNAPTDGRPLVYLSRNSVLAFGAVPAIFLVDGVKVATLQNGGCAAVSVMPGDHLIAEKWFSIPFLFGPTFAKQVGLQATWEPGQTYYYRLETQLHYVGVDVIKWRISALDPQAGAAEVAGRSCQTPH